jgi:outer membrane protein assembly factor BamB
MFDFHLFPILALCSLKIIDASSWTEFHGNGARTGRSQVAGPLSGNIDWKTTVGCHHWGKNCWIPGFQGTDSSPSVSYDGTTIYIGSYDHYLYGIDASSGALRWKYFTGSAGIGIESSPAVTQDNVVIVGTYGKFILVFDYTV